MSKHKGPGRDSSSAEAIAVAERHAKWLGMRKRGKSYRAIAADEGVTTNAVFEAVHGALKLIRTEPAEELRAMELEALDDEIDRVLGVVATATEVSEVLACSEQIRKHRADRRKILGVDAPTKSIDLTPKHEETVATVVALLENPTEEFAKMLSDAGWVRK